MFVPRCPCTAHTINGRRRELDILLRQVQRSQRWESQPKSIYVEGTLESVVALCPGKKKKPSISIVMQISGKSFVPVEMPIKAPTEFPALLQT